MPSRCGSGFEHPNPSEITPPTVYQRRRDLMRVLATGVAGVALAQWVPSCDSRAEPPPTSLTAPAVAPVAAPIPAADPPDPGNGGLGVKGKGALGRDPDLVVPF